MPTRVTRKRSSTNTQPSNTSNTDVEQSSNNQEPSEDDKVAQSSNTSNTDVEQSSNSQESSEDDKAVQPSNTSNTGVEQSSNSQEPSEDDKVAEVLGKRQADPSWEQGQSSNSQQPSEGVASSEVLGKRQADPSWEQGLPFVGSTSLTAPHGHRNVLLDSSIGGESEVALSADQTRNTPFCLDPTFVASFANIDPPFGFNGLGAVVYLSHYARKRPDGMTERWYQTCERVVNGTYNMQKNWIEENDIGWKPCKAQRSAQEFFTRMFHLKFCPPGRGLWAMGTPITEKIRAFAALNNCAFVSTIDCGVEGHEIERSFYVGMEMLMFGIGVGFDTRGAANNVKVYAPIPGCDDVNSTKLVDDGSIFVVPDSREGWVESVRLQLHSYFTPNQREVSFDYSLVRPAGQPLRTFGGTSGGPKPLQDLHVALKKTLDARVGNCLTVTDIADIFNHIGMCVVAGNIRRSAEIAFGLNHDEEFMNLKNYDLNPQRAMYGGASNNTILCEQGDDYTRAAELVRKNGEPGVCWLGNMRNYSRMGRAPDMSDLRAMGGNPCLEQTLEPYEVCCLVETFPHHHLADGMSLEESKADYLRTLKFAYLYAKTVTLGKTKWVETNRVMMRNRRIGCSVTGIAQFIARTNENWDVLRKWLDQGYDRVQYYDEVYSKWLCIPRSIKTTSVKPSGTVSLVAGCTPGIHYPEARFYLRRKTFAKNDPRDAAIVELLRENGYIVEQSVYSESAWSVAVPIDAGAGVRPQAEVSMWEQLSLAAFMQKHWSDNQVSATISFDEQEGKDIGRALQVFQSQLKGVSFLSKDTGAYEQKPYTAITEERYNELMSQCKPITSAMLYDLVDKIDLANIEAGVKPVQPAPERFCDGDRCVLVQ